MPMYEYKCTGCGVEFEVMRKFSDAPVTECAECGGKVEKLISRSSFQLKGGGWYADGYSSTGNSSAGNSPAGNSPAGNSPAGNSNDKKGAACDAKKPECAGCPSAEPSS